LSSFGCLPVETTKLWLFCPLKQQKDFAELFSGRETIPLVVITPSVVSPSLSQFFKAYSTFDLSLLQRL
jgi:hypothetical protein